jgi:hypothetical protein
MPASISINGSSLGNQLSDLLQAEDIQPGDDPSYQLCKTIYLYHPLGAKMAEAPIKMAQSQKREIVVSKSPQDRVKNAFEEMWTKLGCDGAIKNVASLSRVYGIATLTLMAEGVPPGRPLDYKELSKLKTSFNVYDPLNTAGSLVLNQNPLSIDFMKPDQVSVQGSAFHRSRSVVVLNEEPIYIAFTQSAFGFVGRSVYQRALFPLKSFLQTLLTDDLVTVKVGVLIAKIKAPGSIINNMMQLVWGQKRGMIREASSGGVISIGPDDAIESLNFRNLDGPYQVVRTNILKNIATAADMPAKLLENETMVGGMAEGTEDAKNIAKYIDGVRTWLRPLYQFCDKVCMYKAWTPEFYETLKADFPEYETKSYTEAFYDWVNTFAFEWPSLLTEPPSEQQKVDKTRLDAMIEAVEVLLPAVDPDNRNIIIQWLADNFNELKLLFPNELMLDFDALENFDPQAAMMQNGGGGGNDQSDDEDDGEGDDEEDGDKQPGKQAAPKEHQPKLPRADSAMVNVLTKLLRQSKKMDRAA